MTRPLTRPYLCCETLQFISWNFCGEAPTDKTGPLLRNFAIHFVKLLRWSTYWQDRTFAAKLCNSFCETFAVKCLLTKPDLCCETLQFILWNFCGEAPTDKTGPLLRNFAIHFVKLLRWSIHWQDQTFAAKLCNSFCETFAVKHPLTRPDLCCETLQFILWNFCGEAPTDKTGPLLRNFAIHFVKLLHWSIHWQDQTFAAKLCNSFCETFAVKCRLTRPDLCCETLQFILWNFRGEAPTEKTGPLLRNFAIHFVKRLRWSIHWQDQTFAAKLCNSFCETFAVKHLLTRPDLCCETLQWFCETFAVKHPLTRPDLCCETLQFILWNFCGEASTDKTGPLLRNFAIHFVKLLRWSTYWQDQTFATKLCNSFCETFAVKCTCPLTRPVAQKLLACMYFVLIMFWRQLCVIRVHTQPNLVYLLSLHFYYGT